MFSKMLFMRNSGMKRKFLLLKKQVAPYQFGNSFAYKACYKPFVLRSIGANGILMQIDVE